MLCFEISSQNQQLQKNEKQTENNSEITKSAVKPLPLGMGI